MQRLVGPSVKTTAQKNIGFYASSTKKVLHQQVQYKSSLYSERDVFVLFEQDIYVIH